MSPEQLIAGIVVAVLGLGGSIFGALALFAGTKGKTKADAKTAFEARLDVKIEKQMARLDETVQKLEERVGELEEREVRRSSAFARILRAIARQWPGDSSGPDLDPADIAEIEDTIPPQWIRRHPEMLRDIDKEST